MAKLNQAKPIMVKLIMAKLNYTKLNLAKLNHGLNIYYNFFNFIFFFVK